MKTRQGLVSNSSSTSFMICIAPGIKDEDLAETLGIKEGSPAEEIFESTIDTILNAKPKTEKEYLDDHYCLDTWEEVLEQDLDELGKSEILLKEAFQKGWSVRSGWVDRGAEPWYSNVIIRNNKIIFITED